MTLNREIDMKTSFLFLCICAFLHVPATELSAQTGSLRGQILDSNGAPVAGTRIHVLGTTRGALSKPDGYYFIAGINEGTYEVHIAHFQRLISLTQKQVRIEADEVTELHIRLPKDSTILPADTIVAVEEEINRALNGIQRPVPPPEGGGFDIRPRRPAEDLKVSAASGTLSGKVIDTDSKGVLGATVRITGTKKGAMVRNADGTFQVQEIPAGTYRLSINAVGKVSQEIRVEIIPGEDTVITIILEDPPVYEDDPFDT